MCYCSLTSIEAFTHRLPRIQRDAASQAKLVWLILTHQDCPSERMLSVRLYFSKIAWSVSLKRIIFALAKQKGA